MPKRYSLHIGLNRVNGASYPGYSIPNLAGCVRDAEDMLKTALGSGITNNCVLIDSRATRENVVSAIGFMAATMVAGDFFFLTYSGHGGQLRDRNGDEADGIDETWCLYNCNWVDDSLAEMLGRFKEGVRVFMLSDSCHSGTVLDSTANLKCDCILISGCKDNQYSSDGPKNGLFTENFLKVWNGGKYKKTYVQFHQDILSLMPKNQQPVFTAIGPHVEHFKNQIPFM